MTTSHHESKREWLGAWWEPVKPTIRAAGRLICGPEYLSLVFPSEWDGDALRTARTEGIDALYGLTDSPDAITILGVTPDPTGYPLAATSSVFRRVELLRVYGKAALVGIHVPVPTEVSEATVTMDGLAEWCGRPSLYGPDGEVVAWFPNDPKWEQLVAVVPGGQVTLESGYRFTMGTISFTALPYSQLVLSPSDPLDLEVFISQWLAPIQSLFCILLATGSRSSVTVRLTTHTPGSELPLVLPSRMQAEAVVDQAGWYELGAILPYQLVAARFQELVSSWLALYPAKKVAIDRLVSNLFAPFFYDDDRFLTDVAALDGYTAEELQRVPNEIQRAAVAAAKAMDPRYGKIVRDLLRARDRPSLERRLESLMRELQPLTEFLIPYEPHRERFAHLIPKLRNPLAHAGEPHPFLSAGHRDPLHQAAMWLMRTAVLRDLGIDPGAVAGELEGRIGMAELQRALANVLDKEA